MTDKVLNDIIKSLPPGTWYYLIENDRVVCGPWSLDEIKKRQKDFPGSKIAIFHNNTWVVCE